MNHVYTNGFFDYIERGSISSSEIISSLVLEKMKVGSLLDVGCGRGAWLRSWRRNGVNDIVGADGDYVDRSSLLIPTEAFRAIDLLRPFDLGRTFDLATCLEVAEHLDPKSSAFLIKSLAAHSKMVMFSAAVPGQGGEHHINERSLEFWRSLFAKHGYSPFDFIRPAVNGNTNVEPWYRYNTLLYVHESAVDALPSDVKATKVPTSARIMELATPQWRLRRAAVRALPQPVVTKIAVWNAKFQIRRAAKKMERVR